jgi:hypothetical protein
MLDRRHVRLAPRRSLFVAAIASWSGLAATPADLSFAQSSERIAVENSDNEIVVTGISGIVVNGRARRCRPVAEDPLDAVDLRSGYDTDPHSGLQVAKYMAIIPDGPSGYIAAPNAEQITGPAFWQRIGVGMDQYVFRAPSNNRPMCVGGSGGIDRFAGFRRIVHATPYRGRRLRFTAWVATGGAQQVSFWLAAGTQWHQQRGQLKARRTETNRLLNGGNTNAVPFGGNHGWTPVLIEIGPIHKDADHISYGFDLQGSGDVWVYEPKLEIVANGPDPRTGNIIMIGRDQ